MSNTFSFNELETYRIYLDDFARETENAILTGKYGIYIPKGTYIHAYYGTQEIDQALCNELNVIPVNLRYSGGTIIGSDKDLSILMVLPELAGMSHETIINKVADLIGKYIPNVTVDGNDILVDGEKVCGSMVRIVCGTFVWAAQISFADYSDYIAQICNKPAVKKPSYIDNTLLTRNQLEDEIIHWLTNEI